MDEENKKPVEPAEEGEPVEKKPVEEKPIEPAAEEKPVEPTAEEKPVEEKPAEPSGEASAGEEPAGDNPGNPGPADKKKGTAFSLRSGLIGLGIGLVATVLIALIVVTVGIYKFGWSGPAVDVATQALPYPAATVNGETIRLAEFNHDVETLKHFYSKAEEYGIDNFGAEPTEAELRQNAMDRLIRNRLLAEEAANFGITVSQDEVDSEFQKLVGSSSDSEIRKQISDLYGWTEAQFKQKVIKPYLLEAKLAEALADDESISGKTKEQAESVMKELEEGADFSQMAAAYSDDQSNAQNGGQLGWFGRGTMVEEFEEAAFALEPGELGGPVQTKFGYHIILVDDTKLDDDGEVKEVSASHILFRTQTVSEYLEKKLEEAKIKKYVDAEA